VAVVVAAIMLVTMVRLVGSVISGADADITADWLVRSAVRDGVDPAVGLRELGRRYRVEYLGEGEHEVPVVGRLHPRTPGALVLMTPLLLLGPGEIFLAWNVVNGLAMAALMAVSVLVAGRERWPHALALLPLVPAMLPVWRGLEFGAHSAVLAVATWVFVIATRGRDRFWPGLLLGAVIAMRLFPALVLIPAVRWGRWRAAGTAVTVAFLLTLGGLALPTVGLSQSVGQLRASTEQWAAFSFNTSIVKGLADFGMPIEAAAALAIGLGLISALTIVTKVRRYDLALAAVLVVALLTSPLSWIHYDLFLVPGAFLVLWTARSHVSRIFSASYLGGWVAAGVVVSFAGSGSAESAVYVWLLRGLLLWVAVGEGVHPPGDGVRPAPSTAAPARSLRDEG
jgi:hypothetical protein